MTTAIASNALVSLLVLVALAFVIYGPWQWACTDYARQIVFEKRDEIFDMAADGRLSFKSAEYRTIRASLEASIRFAHDLTVPGFLFMLLFRKESFSEKSDLHVAVHALPDEVREEVENKVSEAMQMIIVMMVLKSPIACLVILPLGIVASLVESCRNHATTLASWLAELIQVEAERSPVKISIDRHHGMV